MASPRSILARMEHASTWSRASWGPLARWQWLSLIGLALFLYTFRLGAARTLTDHEAYVAGPARQMVTTGEWLVPRLGHVLWLEKPPLAQWLAGLSASAAGRFDEATVRLPSALAGVGVVLLLAWIVAHLFEATVGYVAGLLMATSVFMLQTARQAVADMHLACLVLAAIAVFVDLHFRGGPRARWRVWLFWLLLGLMNLSKGPLFGAALVLVTCGGWLALRRDYAGLRRFASPIGMLLALAIGAAWPVMVGLKHPEAWELWRQHLLGRFSGSDLALYHKPFWYYVPSAAWQWLPWTPLILLGAAGSLREACRPVSPKPAAGFGETGLHWRFVWWWFAGQFALLSCAAGKSHVYLLHALPALAPVAAVGALRVGRWVQSGAAAVNRLGKFLLIATPVTAIGGWLAADRWAAWLAADLYVLAALLSAAAIGLGLSLLRHRPAWVLAASVAYVTIAAAYATGWVMHYRDPSLADRRFLAEVDHRLSPNDLLLGTDFIGLPRYIFYLDHAVEGYLIPEHFPPLPTDRHHAYVLARAAQADQLKRLGEVHIVAQSERTRRETGPQDRFTLFRVEAGVGIAAKPSAAPH